MLGLVLAAVVFSPAEIAADHVRVRLSSPAAGVARAGGAFTVQVHFDIDPDWHLYWLNPGDSGEPPKVKWTLPPGWTAAPLVFPPPERHETGPLVNYVYERALTLTATVTGPASAAPARLSARLSWLVCQEDCVPGFATVTVDVPRIEAPSVAAPKSIEPLATTYAVVGRQARIRVPPLAQLGAEVPAALYGEVPGVLATKPQARREGDAFVVDLGPVAKPNQAIPALVVAGARQWRVLAKAEGSAAARAPEPVAATAAWAPWSAARVAALRAEGKAVFVRFTADWCVPCKVAERQLFATDAGRAAFARAGVVPLVADWTDANEAVEAALKGFGKNSIPLYVLYRPGVAEPETFTHAPASPAALEALLRRSP